MLKKKQQESEIILKIDNISKKYKKNQILENISFELKKGEVLGLVGYSGSGKTTLINILCGLIRSDSGSIKYYFNNSTDGENVLLKLNNNLKEKISVSIQKPSFYGELNVIQNLEYFSSSLKLKKQEKKTNIEKILQVLGLLNVKKIKANDLSGGMKKRLDIACSLVSTPEILILDEPTDSLDFKLRNEFLELIKSVKKLGVSIIFVSHILEEIEIISDRIAFLENKTITIHNSSKNIKKLFLKRGD